MEICLITCNIRFDNPADGLNSWGHRRDFLAQTLLKHNPYIIATQEGRFHQLNELKSSLKDYSLIDPHRSWIEERMYPSIFIREGIFNLISSGDHWLSTTPHIPGSSSFESAFPRLMTWAKIQLKETLEEFTIINTHLDHIKHETRHGQVNVLIQEINKIWDAKSSLVIMGDFNDSPHSPIRESLVQSFPFLQDAWSLHNQVEEASHHSFKGEMQNGSRIDWVLVQNSIFIKNCVMDKTTQNGNYPTDHYPIICHIKF